MPKLFFTILLLLHMPWAFANMASPVNEGTMSSRMITSKDVRILNERIHIKIDKHFKLAHYKIEYHIHSNQETNDIPLLFFAMDRSDDFLFRVWLDGKPVKLISDTVRKDQIDERNKKFIEQYVHSGSKRSGCLHFDWGTFENRCFDVNDLNYFETELTKGEHTIRVEYVGNVWTDRSDWIETKSFRYSLSPARNWKTFGTLELSVDANAYPRPLKLKVGNRVKKVHSKQISQTYTTLPGDYIIIEYEPEVSSFAKLLINIGPGWIALIIIIASVLLHHLQLYRWNNIENGTLRFLFFLLLTFVVSFILCDSLNLAEQFIDANIGRAASRYHGYSFIFILLIIIVWPLYAVVSYQLHKRR